MKQKINALSVEFLYELYATAIRNDYVCGILVEHMRKEYLPDRTFQKVQQVLANHYKTYKTPPSYSVLSQGFTGDYDAIELINTFQEFDDGNNPEVMVDMLESYIKGVRLQSVYSEVGKLYNESKQDEAQDMLKAYAEWLSGFTLKFASPIKYTLLVAPVNCSGYSSVLFEFSITCVPSGNVSS